MVIISAFKKYFALDSKQKEFIKNRQRTFLEKPKQLLEFLKPLANFDKECDAARRQAGIILVVLILTSITLAILNANQVFVIPFMDYLSPIALVVFLAFLLAYFLLARIDLPNNLRDFVVPVLNTISQDMDKNEKIRLKLDLRGKMLAAKKLKTDKDDPGWFSYPKITRTFYKDNWLDASAMLFDGSKVFFSVSDTIVQTQKKKKNPRGKIKHKTKVKVKSRIKVGLAMKSKNYQFKDNQRLADSGYKVKGKQGTKRNVLSVCKSLVFPTVDYALEPAMMLAPLGKILMNTNPATKG